MIRSLLCGVESSYTFAFSRALQVNTLEWIASEDSEIKPAAAKSMENVAPIGKGAFGDVFMVMNRSSEKYCAVKFISKQSVFERNSIDNLQREIDIAPKLKHTFISTYFVAYETPSCIGLAFELAYGGVLTDRITLRGYLPNLEAKFYFCEILSALHFLHETVRVIHRDIRTDNILIDSTGHVKLCDFGLTVSIRDVMALNERFEGTTTSSKHMILKRDKSSIGFDNPDYFTAYMAPELIIKDYITEACAPKVDYFSLGCVLFEMITGNAPINSITCLAPSLPFVMRATVKRLLRGLLLKDPAQRFGLDHIMMSPWVSDVNWEKLEDRRCFPPWIPVASKQPTLKYFKPVGDFIDTMKSVDPKVDYYFKTIRLHNTSKSNSIESVFPSSSTILDKQKSVQRLSTITSLKQDGYDLENDSIGNKLNSGKLKFRQRAKSTSNIVSLTNLHDKDSYKGDDNDQSLNTPLQGADNILARRYSVGWNKPSTVVPLTNSFTDDNSNVSNFQQQQQKPPQRRRSSESKMLDSPQRNNFRSSFGSNHSSDDKPNSSKLNDGLAHDVSTAQLGHIQRKTSFNKRSNSNYNLETVAENESSVSIQPAAIDHLQWRSSFNNRSPSNHHLDVNVEYGAVGNNSGSSSPISPKRSLSFMGNNITSALNSRSSSFSSVGGYHDGTNLGSSRESFAGVLKSADSRSNLASGRKKSVKFGENVDLFAQGPAPAIITTINPRSRRNSSSNLYNTTNNNSFLSASPTGPLVRRKSEIRTISGR